jgi:CheY-like chemotaxis protein
MAIVLQVKDDTDNREIHRTVVERPGHDDIPALDGGAGLPLAREHHPSVIRMDAAIPVLDGRDATDPRSGLEYVI